MVNVYPSRVLVIHPALIVHAKRVNGSSIAMKFIVGNPAKMEWLELLKMLSDQQTNETTQQQIELLQGQIHLIQAAQEGLLRFIWLVAVSMIGLFLFNVFLDFWNLRKLTSKIDKLQAHISGLNSIN